MEFCKQVRMRSRVTSVAAWCLFDWAIAPFPTVVTTFVFSTYFAKALASDPTQGSADWSFMVATAGIAIGILSPLLGAIADRMGHAKRGIALFIVPALVASGLLWFARPDPALGLPVLILVGIGIVAFELALLFYNALLPSVAPEGRIGRVSGWGWAAGYAGGLGCLIVALVFLVQPLHPIFGISLKAAANIRACGPLIALWMALFGWPLFALVPDAPRTGGPAKQAIREGLGELRVTLTRLRALPQMLRFLIASAFYRDGVTTILAIGGVYAGVTFGMDLGQVILFGIGLNVAASLGAAGFAWIDDWLGSKRTILIALLGLILFGASIIVVTDKTWFIVLGLALGIFVGPAQSASRSLVVRLAPEGQVGRFFGLYALTGRAASFLGPLLFGIATQVTHSQRMGLTVILSLLVIGLLVLLSVREREPIEEEESPDEDELTSASPR